MSKKQTSTRKTLATDHQSVPNHEAARVFLFFLTEHHRQLAHTCFTAPITHNKSFHNFMRLCVSVKVQALCISELGVTALTCTTMLSEVRIRSILNCGHVFTQPDVQTPASLSNVGPPARQGYRYCIPSPWHIPPASFCATPHTRPSTRLLFLA